MHQSRYGIHQANSLQKFNNAYILGGDGLQDNGICCDYEYIIFDKDNIYLNEKIGGTGIDELYNLLPGQNNQIYLYGSSLSDDGDVSGHYGSGFSPDFWIYSFSYATPCLLSIKDTLCYDESIEVGNQTFDVTNPDGEVEIGQGTDGCDSIVRVDLSFYPEIQLLFENVEDDDGTGSGSIQIIAFGGTGNLSYQWSNGETSESISNLSPGTYTLVISDFVGCTAEFTFEVDGPVNIDETISKEKYFWPNPTSDILFLDKIEENTKVFIYNSLGILQNNIYYSNNSIDVSQLDVGLYNIVVLDDAGFYARGTFIKK